MRWLDAGARRRDRLNSLANAYPRQKPRTRFAWLPTRVGRHWVWLEPYLEYFHKYDNSYYTDRGTWIRFLEGTRFM